LVRIRIAKSAWGPAFKLKNPGFDSGHGQGTFLFSKNMRGSPCLLFNGEPAALSPGIKQPVHEVDL